MITCHSTSVILRSSRRGADFTFDGHRQTRILALDGAEKCVMLTSATKSFNLAGLRQSSVIAPDEKGNIFASARSIGEINVQILMEKLGGGGNRSAAAAQFEESDLEEVVARVRAAIDEYLDQ